MNGFNNRKNILITLWYCACGYHGGTMYAAELGDYLSSLGYNVYLAAIELDDMTKEFLKNHHVKAFPMDKLPLNIHYEYVFAKTFPIFPALVLKGLSFTKVAYSSMSSFLGIDLPSINYDKMDALLVVSEENKEVLVDKYGINSNNITVINNIVPLKYFSNYKVLVNDTPTNIAIVSNYPPQELIDFVEVCKKENITVDIYGYDYKYIPITPDVLKKYDVVISIGKTVQYTLALGIPIYCYGRFGGCGYINLNNIDKEEYYNFSGRCTKEIKKPQEILNDIKNQYQNTIQIRKSLNNIAYDRYSIDKQVNKILDILNNSSKDKYTLETDDLIMATQYEFMCNVGMQNFNRIKCLSYEIDNIHKSSDKKLILQNLFSVKNEYSNNKKHKILTILGIKMKFKQKQRSNPCARRESNLTS